MEKLFTLTDGTDIFFRPVGIDKNVSVAQDDYSYCYDLAQRTVMDDVIALAGEWPEQQQKEFFSSDFFQDDTYILIAGDKRIGCFGIHETDDSVLLCKSYIEPEYQGMGIWKKSLDIALDMANDVQKPLSMAVLISNKDMLETAHKYGFVETEGLIMHEESSWVRMHIMAHKSTLRYDSKADLNASHDFQ